jgi:zinc transporter, ZIP family
VLLHNIPEGMAVGIPLYASTGSVLQVLWWTLLNGLAEPAGVLIGGMLLAPYLDEYILSRCLALVGGIMFCISIHELYPVAIKYCGKGTASVSLMGGMFLCWTALESVESYFDGIDMPGHSHSHGHSHGHGH